MYSEYTVLNFKNAIHFRIYYVYCIPPDMYKYNLLNANNPDQIIFRPNIITL